jgi:Ni/Fe-hydrogenase subunit HybB-like protein
MSGRTTPKGGGDPSNELPSLKERNPLAWWVAIIAVIGLFVGTFAGALVVLLA